MSDTPETDALNAERQEVHASFFIMLNHARKLERERDEAREALARLCRAAVATCDRWDTPLWKDAPATARFMRELREAVCPQNAEVEAREKSEYLIEP
jgi:hypothetical protein